VATPIAYIFTGTGTGTLNGTPFSGSFTVREVGDTSGVSGPSGGEFTNVASSANFVADALTATLTGTTNEVIDNTAAPRFIAFAQLPAIAVEATINAAFETYQLKTALPLTIGTPNGVNLRRILHGGQLGFRHHHGAKLPDGYALRAGAGLPGAAWHGSRWVQCG
jgi:hypothetical protein